MNRAMAGAVALTKTTIGQKALVALTGAILFGFVLGHLAGNLTMFAGPEAYNGYAEALKANLPLLWGVRTTLLVSVIVHIALTVKLASRNAGARAVGYRKAREDLVTTYAARTMILSGPILFLFIVFHIAHFTAPGLGIGFEFDVANPFGNLVQSFRVWWISAIYIFANVLLGMHLYHGGWSILQSLGANHRRYNAWAKRGAIALALLVSAGNVGLPIAVMFGVVDLDSGIPALEEMTAEEEEDGAH
jgi:succinate dehydrogenase / fumarate reductase cytochrome b subunit